ncbi:MAG TPA: sugar-binding protein, partial [Candidatus Brocadiia bacterium]|nr:sugar-binding protein [Candidatus Brocadiia bacterium]
IWIVHRKLAEEMRKLRPGKKVMIISYGPTSSPPVSFKTFPDNVVIQMCRYAPEDFDAWKSFNVPSTVYVYNWGSYQIPGFGPKRTPKYAADQVKRFARGGVAGIYLCGAFENLGLEGPVYYVYGKTLGDPSLSEAELLGDYCRAAFGKARAPMRKFFEAMYGRLEAFSLTNRPNYRVEAPAGAPTFATPEDFYCHFFPAKLLAEMAASLNRAKAADDDPGVQARLSLVEREFAYVRNLASIFQLYRAYRLRPGWQTFDLLASELDQREALLNSWFDDKGAPKPFDGWTRFLGGATLADVRVGGRLGGTLSAPVNWNTRLLREKQVLPGVGAKTLHVARLRDVKLDGVLNDPAWSAAQPQELSEIGMGELPNGARFRVGRDDNAFYVAFECDHENLAKLDVQPRGQDGAVWQDECVELLIDPFGGREKYYHFILAPVPGSRYDARKGFIDDPIHPLFNKADKSWNGKWDYAVHADPQTGKWTAEVRIPFSTLGVDAPQAGSSWTMNAARAQYLFKNGKRPDPVLSLWSPNLEERSFHSTAAFGDVVFD